MPISFLGFPGLSYLATTELGRCLLEVSVDFSYQTIAHLCDFGLHTAGSNGWNGLCLSDFEF
jgi:hypothetical protein